VCETSLQVMHGVLLIMSVVLLCEQQALAQVLQQTCIRRSEAAASLCRLDAYQLPVKCSAERSILHPTPFMCSSNRHRNIL
jgi:hypothetical protein